MTYQQVYLAGKTQLTKAGIESPAFDVLCLFSHVFSMDRAALSIHGAEPAPEALAERFRQCVAERCQHRPLQYILGTWPFLDLTLSMGEGVLSPREDTEVLVQAAEELLRSIDHPVVLDLCAGTGAVGIGFASLHPGASVTCVELHPHALSYLQQNCDRYRSLGQFTIRQADVLLPPDPLRFGKVDAILSNPPYIESAVIDTLQPEVQQEPRTALDGGADGLHFYRRILQGWLPLLKPGGWIALEVGEGQAQAVSALLSAAGIQQIQTKQDLSGIDRVVFGTTQKE